VKKVLSLRDIKWAENFKKPENLPEKSKQKLFVTLDSYLDNMQRQYQRKDYREHVKTTYALLRYTNHIPIYYLVEAHNVVINKLKKYGLKPYMSFIVDYAIRLYQFPSDDSRSCYNSLKSMFIEKNTYWNGDALVLLRTKSGKSYRIHSENVGWLVGLFVFSEYGQQQIDIGYNAEHFLVPAALYNSCLERELAERDIKSDYYTMAQNRERLKGINICEIFARNLEDKMGPDASAKLRGGFNKFFDEGFKTGMSECLESLSDNTISEMVQNVEDYMECQYAEDSYGDSQEWLMDGAGGYRLGNFIITFQVYEDSSGYRHLRTTSTNVTSPGYIETDINLDTRKSTYESHDFTSGIRIECSGGSCTTTNEDGMVTNYSDSEGNSYNAEINPNGTLGNETITENLGDGVTKTTEVQRDSNGNITGTTVTETTDNGDGTTTIKTTTYDADGNVVSSTTHKIQTTPSETQGSPIDEYISDPCIEQLIDNLIEETKFRNEITKLETQILPNPEITVGAEDNPCFSGFGNAQPRNCTSVWLCLEGQVNEDCSCGVDSGAVIPDNDRVCIAIRCEDGYSCNPGSGTCSSTSSDYPTFTPGFYPPQPQPQPLDIDVPNFGVIPEMPMDVIATINRDLSRRVGIEP
jgi:hypothetical protein